MNHKLFCIALAAILSITSFAQNERQQRLEQHVYTLASDEMNGRKAGSEDAARARAYIVKEFEEIGLRPLLPGGYEMDFNSHNVVYTNIVAIIPGTVLSDEYIIVGAHYDHLGIKKGKIYNGADDNASGTAALIEIARDLMAKSNTLKRSIIIAAFDAEELGLYGSEALCNYLSSEGLLHKVKLMMSVDMVGWYGKSGFLKMEGVGTIENGKNIVCELANAQNLNLKIKNFETSFLTATDTRAFAQSQLPTLAITTGLKSPYHKPDDDPELIDYDGLDKVSEYVAEFTASAAADVSFRASGKVSKVHRSTASPFELGLNFYNGSMNLLYNKTGINVQNGHTWAASISLQANGKKLGIRTEAIYDCQKIRLPDAADIFNTTHEMEAYSLTVPLLLMLPATNRKPTFCGVGPYWNHILESTVAEEIALVPRRDTFGTQATFGLMMGPFLASMNFRWQIGKYFTDTNSPARFIEVNLGVGYAF